MTGVLQFVIDALTAGSFYALFALGIALIFGIMRLVNFAHGELIMAGAYVVYLTYRWPWPAMIAAAIVVVVVLALVIERVAFRPVRGANPATLLITSFAVSFLLQNLAQMIFTTLPKSADVLPVLSRSVSIGGLTISWLSVVTDAQYGAVCWSALALFLRRTRLGVQMRAAAEDFEMARLCGVRGNRVIASGVRDRRRAGRRRRGPARRPDRRHLHHDGPDAGAVRVHRGGDRRAGQPARRGRRRLPARRRYDAAAEPRCRTSSPATATPSCSSACSR